MSCSNKIELKKAVSKSNTGADAIKRAPIVEENTGFRCLRIGDISNNRPFKEWGFTSASSDVVEKFELKKDDIVIARTGNTIGVVKYISDDVKSVYNNGLIRIKIDEKFNPKFIYYNLISEDFKSFIYGISAGTSTQPNMKIDHMLQYKITDFNIEEQEKIANILSSLDDKIELNNEMNKTLEEMAQSIFKRWFVDFEFPNEDGEPYKSSGGEMVESELGMIPKGWEVKTIGDLCEVESSKRIFMKEYVDTGIPFFRSKEIIERSKGNSISTELFITEERFNEIKDKFGVPSKNDILLTSVGTLGVPYLVDDEEFYFKDGNLTWFKNFKEEVFRYYIYQWLLSSEGKKSIDEVTIGSTQKVLTINSLKSMKVVIPSENILNKYGGFISSNIENIRENNAQKFNIIDIRDSLLPKLMSGNLQV